MTAFTFRMPFGIPGVISRPSSPYVAEANILGATAFPAYGLLAKIVSNKVVPLSASGDTPYGLLVRPYPTQGPNASDPLGTSTPPTSGVIVLLRSGYMTVYCRAGTPALGGTVYVRYANPSGALIVGGLEATSVGGSNVAVTGAQFQGPADSNGNCEISFAMANTP